MEPDFLNGFKVDCNVGDGVVNHEPPVFVDLV